MTRQTAVAAKRTDPSMVSTRILVQVNRDQTAKTPRVIWHHEFPLLEAVFGEGNVQIVEDTEVLDEGYTDKPSPELMVHNKKQDKLLPPSQTQGLGFVFIGDSRTEYDRLADVYGRHPEVNEAFVQHVYGRYQDGTFARMVGAPTMDDLPDAQIRELAISYGAEADQARAAEGEALRKLAESVGVRLR